MFQNFEGHCTSRPTGISARISSQTH